VSSPPRPIPPRSRLGLDRRLDVRRGDQGIGRPR
jgi:hypothetical protein